LKKIIFSLLLFTSLYSDASIYIGSSYGYINEKFDTDHDAQSSSNMAKLKIGYGDRDAYGIEFSIDYIDNTSKIFSKQDGKKYAMNIELVKAFDFNTFVNPFFKVGFGSGFLDIQREFQTKLNYGSFNLGAGIFIPMNEHFELEVGYDYKAISYESIDTIVEKIRLSSNTNTIYMGFNVRF